MARPVQRTSRYTVPVADSLQRCLLDAKTGIDVPEGSATVGTSLR